MPLRSLQVAVVCVRFTAAASAFVNCNDGRNGGCQQRCFRGPPDSCGCVVSGLVVSPTNRRTCVGEAFRLSFKAVLQLRLDLYARSTPFDRRSTSCRSRIAVELQSNGVQSKSNRAFCNHCLRRRSHLPTYRRQSWPTNRPDMSADEIFCRRHFGPTEKNSSPTFLVSSTSVRRAWCRQTAAGVNSAFVSLVSQFESESCT